MTPDEYNQLQFMAQSSFKLNEIPRLEEDRTLLFGYTLERHTFHVYLHEEKLYLLMWPYDKSFQFCQCWNDSNTTIGAEQFSPSKRTYIDSSEFEFCKFLLSRGVHITFTGGGSSNSNGRYASLIHLDFPGIEYYRG